MVRPWVAALASFHNTPIFGRIWATVAVLAGYAALVVLLDRYVVIHITNVGAGFQGFLGLVLGMLLVFRTNTSYDRWWEGRKLWGQLINDSRNLAIKVKTCVRADAAEKQLLGHWLSSFALALKNHLRRGSVPANLVTAASPETSGGAPHTPAFYSTRIYEQIERWRQSEQVGGFELLFLDQHAASLMNICGACERIQKSPISLSYRWFIRQSIAIYLLALPWGLMDTFGWWTVPAVAMLGYFMVGLEMIAEQIEDPFGVSEDDIMLDELCRTIDTSVAAILKD